MMWGRGIDTVVDYVQPDDVGEGIDTVMDYVQQDDVEEGG